LLLKQCSEQQIILYQFQSRFSSVKTAAVSDSWVNQCVILCSGVNQSVILWSSQTCTGISMLTCRLLLLICNCY